MNPTPTISVLMSVYDAAPFLSASVDSILSQSYADFEFIIIDDGSTDETAEILQDYTDPRIRLLANNQNIGLTRSLNRGLAIAQGRYIARMDADDVSLPHRFAQQVAYLDAHPDIDILGTQMGIISIEGQRLDQYSVPTTHGAIIWALLFGLAIAHPTVFIRREALEQVGGYPDHILRAQDFALWAEMSKRYRFANLPDELHLYRMQPNMISQMYSQAQTQTLLDYRQQMFSRFLDREIPSALVEHAHRSQLKPAEISTFLTNEEILNVLSLMLETFESLCEQGIVQPMEQELVRQDMLHRMMMASRCTAKIYRKTSSQRSIFARLRRMLNA